MNKLDNLYNEISNQEAVRRIAMSCENDSIHNYLFATLTICVIEICYTCLKRLYYQEFTM